jgi:Sec-independent protein secretion pathway component TatC
MGIGILEIAFLVGVTIATALTVMATKRRWVAVVPAFFLIAIFVSPSDIVSTLLIGVPNCVLFVLAFRYFAADGDRHAGSAA